MANEMPEPKWWDSLPDDFYRQADGTEVDADHRVKVRSAAAIDIAMRTGLSAVVGAAVAPSLLLPGRFSRDMQQMQLHQQLADAGDSEAVFGYVKTQVEELRPRAMGYRPSGVDYRLLRFDSPHQLMNPDLAKTYQRGKRNQQAYAQHWFHNDGPRPTLIMLHGFTADAYWFNSQMFSLRWFYRQGYDVLLYTMPFHGYRVDTMDWFSGHRLFAGGLPGFNEGMVHAAREVRVFMDYLEQRGVKHMGVSGLSLGGYLSSLMACVDDRLAFCVPNSPVVSPADIMREWQPTGSMLRYALRKNGYSMPQVRHAMAVHNPLTYAPKIAADRVLNIGGAGDRFTPPRHVRLLHDHHPGSDFHWFPGNHLMHFQQRNYLRLMKSFMDRHCEV